MNLPRNPAVLPLLTLYFWLTFSCFHQSLLCWHMRYLMGISSKPYIPFPELKKIFWGPVRELGDTHEPVAEHEGWCVGWRCSHTASMHTAWGPAVFRGSKAMLEPAHGSFSSWFGEALCRDGLQEAPVSQLWQVFLEGCMSNTTHSNYNPSYKH